MLIKVKLSFLITIITISLSCFGDEVAGENVAFGGNGMLEGVIFSRSQTEQLLRRNAMISVSPPFWEPTVAQALEAQKRVKLYLQTLNTPNTKKILKEIKSYKFQYIGYTESDERWIMINSFCSSVWKANTRWKEEFVFVLDGGACFFQIRYNINKHFFEGFEINGES